METKIKQFWDDFAAEHGLVNVSEPEAWSFGTDADTLAQLVKQGIKTATTSGFELYAFDNDPLPKVGEYNIILDSQNEPVCVTKTKVVEVLPFKYISAEHAYHEGEGDRSYDYWHQVHVDFFTKEYASYNATFTPESKCVCEVFELVE
ncbi:ASCH domain-containing protein [Ligilactobacillus acidipiscis]|jgi:uncharacterized protein YhfF|uniref:ASCH domain-containing protein n=1 Tax=Ligilactobacillus acidipiscis TaxID=89059 RepID=A0A0R2JWE2_9LACO|nr:ASCH domain-containing protein [Ligilactobacillus acidipiscis]KRN81554.1 hypothetical protein IV43_GL001850 [Ligilactobacillus acidipiscis]MCI1924804.1 ASCH domain-containing protein [Ligilactobacillus acidipiscis]SFV41209.1 hypothetical protein LAC1533_1786 [Ligilactobacillus acidipiscis]